MLAPLRFAVGPAGSRHTRGSDAHRPVQIFFAAHISGRSTVDGRGIFQAKSPPHVLVCFLLCALAAHSIAQGGVMVKPRDAEDGKRKPAKRLLVAGRKINGIWQVRTFLRAASSTTRDAFWETATTAGKAN
jgi:hypothetical protein